ncbi:dTMP kinase [Arcobacter cryaerophilus gv. pseudocryaerophilus]
MYVVIEGIDTAGKSTQLEILKNKFPNAIFTKEPGGTALGIKLREMILSGEANSSLAEMFMFLADRAEHTQEIILKNKNKLIVSDRSFISGIAYAKDRKIDDLIELNRLATSNNFPQKVILLELKKDELQKRLSQKQNDSIEKRGLDYLLDIQARLKETILKLNIKHIFIDASLNIDEIAKKIEDFINEIVQIQFKV